MLNYVSLDFLISRFGINCAKRCNCYNQPCDGVTGLCKCNPGYRGHQCELKCPLGRFGNKCKQTCACKNGASCDGVSNNLDEFFNPVNQAFILNTQDGCSFYHMKKTHNIF